jgi:transposase
MIDMMGRQSGQIVFEIIDIDSMVPKDHMLRKIQQNTDFSFIYEKTKDLYASNGRPSVVPVLLIKMLLIGYLYGIKSGRKLEEEINLNLAYRWFRNLNVSDRISDHSTFSQNRKRRFDQSGVFEDIFSGIFSNVLHLDWSPENVQSGMKVTCQQMYPVIPKSHSRKL